MKITKNRLKQIIKEELKKILEGDVIPFQQDRVSAQTYEGEGEVLDYPDPLKDMKNEIFTFLKNTTSIDQNLEQNLDKIFFGLDKDKAVELHDKIFIKAINMDRKHGNSAERVLQVINALAAKKTPQEREDYLKKEKNK